MAQVLSKPLTRRGQFWRVHIEQWQATGRTQIHYCKDQGLSLSAFRWWRRRLLKRGEAQSIKKPLTIPQAEAMFAEIPIHKLNEVAGYAYEITLPNQMQLRFKSHFEPEAVASLLSLLEQAC